MTPRRVLFLAAAPLLLALAACAGGSASDPASSDSITVQYLGEDLHCTEPGSLESSTLSCDFVKFYYQHPGLLDKPTKEDGEDVKWYEEQGESLPCVRRGSAKAARISCDWQRFYALHPDLTGLPR